MSNTYIKGKPTEPRPGAPKCAPPAPKPKCKDCDDTGNYYNIGLQCHCKVENSTVNKLIEDVKAVIARQNSDSFDHFCSNAELLEAIEHLKAARMHIEEALKPQDPNNY